MKIIRRQKLTVSERLEKLMLIGSLKVINGISNYGRHFVTISPWTRNLLSRQISKTKSIYHFDFG